MIGGGSRGILGGAEQPGEFTVRFPRGARRDRRWGCPRVAGPEPRLQTLEVLQELSHDDKRTVDRERVQHSSAVARSQALKQCKETLRAAEPIFLQHVHQNCAAGGHMLPGVALSLL